MLLMLDAMPCFELMANRACYNEVQCTVFRLSDGKADHVGLLVVIVFMVVIEDDMEARDCTRLRMSGVRRVRPRLYFHVQTRDQSGQPRKEACLSMLTKCLHGGACDNVGNS